LQLLELSAKGSESSEYRVEAAIAAVHTLAPSVRETNWEKIVLLYDSLMSIRPSPIVALNRAIAVGQLAGPKRGLKELRAIVDSERLGKYSFSHAALGESELQNGHTDIARDHFSIALRLSRNPMERQFFCGRVEACNSSLGSTRKQ
jgi:RNA polymerase sigma-70 factor (ECF subfamily)